MKKVRVYTTNYCPYCQKAKSLLKLKNISFEEIDLTDNQALRDELEEKTGWMTVPMIFIGEKFVGGFDNLAELEAKKELDSMVRG